jgi:hypothetical protein
VKKRVEQVRGRQGKHSEQRDGTSRSPGRDSQVELRNSGTDRDSQLAESKIVHEQPPPAPESGERDKPALAGGSRRESQKEENLAADS